MNFTCPSCHMENAYLESADESGGHYTCPDCDFEWSDSHKDEDEDDEELIQMDNCPNCSKMGNRLVYECEACQFAGCYDEKNFNGCFEDSNGKVACPKCNMVQYEIVAKIGKGWDE